MSCGGGPTRIPISTGGCGSDRYLYISRDGCGGVSFTVDAGGCGGKVEASKEDIMKAFNNIRNENY